MLRFNFRNVKLKAMPDSFIYPSTYPKQLLRTSCLTVHPKHGARHMVRSQAMLVIIEEVPN